MVGQIHTQTSGQDNKNNKDKVPMQVAEIWNQNSKDCLMCIGNRQGNWN